MKPRRRPRHLEESLQTTCVQWFRLRYPGRLIFAIPNGGKRNVMEAVRLKSQGVLPGVPDLFIPEPVNGKPGMWIEMKSEKGRTSKLQGFMIEALRGRGYEAVVCKSFLEFSGAVQKYLGGK